MDCRACVSAASFESIPTTWVPEVLIRASSEEKPRLHDVAFDNEGNIWVVTGNNSTGYADGKPG